MLPSEEAAAYRACAHDECRARARERLAAAVRAQLLRGMRSTLRGRGAPIPDDLEDRVQERALALVDRVTAGQVVAGGEDAYIARAANNAAIDALRGRGDARRHEIPHDDTAMHGRAATDPFADMWRDADADEKRRLVDAALQAAPAAYADVLRRYIAGESVESIVERELATRDGTVDDDARTRAENTVHARLSRARRWVRLHVDAAGGDDAR